MEGKRTVIHHTMGDTGPDFRGHDNHGMVYRADIDGRCLTGIFLARCRGRSISATNNSFECDVMGNQKYNNCSAKHWDF